jgi:hypothetical protein
MAKQVEVSAVLPSDHEVELIRILAEDMRQAGATIKVISESLAAKFEVHPRTIVKYVYGERRGRATPRR